MATIARARPSTATSRQSSRPVNLPPYQPLSHDLNHTAQHTLRNLPTSHNLNDLKRRLQTAVNHLTEVTGDLNDQCQIRIADHEKQKARRAARAESSQGGDRVDDDGDQQMEDIQQRAEEWTSKMEEKTRKVIDVQARVVDGEKALKEMSTNITQGRTATQSTPGLSQYQHHPQRQQRPRRGRHEDSDDDSENDTDASQSENNEGTFTGPSPLTTYKSHLSTSSSSYASLSLKDRYATHNDYIGFRKIVHDALHPNDDTPLPHPSTWFRSSSSSNPPNSQNPLQQRNLSRSASATTGHPTDTQPSNNNDNDEDDDDILIAREKRSIRCPLTLLPIHDPLTSTLCPHNFERSAILSMLDSSTTRINEVRGVRGSGEKVIKCPECDVRLTKGDLRVDKVLVRKIRRIEEKERRDREGDSGDDEEDGDDAGGRKRVEEVTSSPAQVKPAGGPVKIERGIGVRGGTVTNREVSMVPGTQVSRAGREVSMVPATQIVDLGDEDEDQGEDEDDHDHDEDVYPEEE